MEPIEVVLWLHGDNEQNVELGEAAGLGEVALDYFGGALHEVKVTCLVDPKTGHYTVKSWEEI